MEPYLRLVKDIDTASATGVGVETIVDSRKPVSTDVVTRTLTGVVGKLAKPAWRPIAVIDILRLVTEFYSITARDVYASNKRARITEARHVIMYLARRELNETYSEIAKVMRRNHATVIAGIDRITLRRVEDSVLIRRLEALETSIRGLTVAIK